MLIRFTEKIDYLKDEITNGFTLRRHPISFRSDLKKILKYLVPYWKDIGPPTVEIQRLIEIYNSSQSYENFISAMEQLMLIDHNFAIHVNLYTFQKENNYTFMKCFTELRDNQKVNPRHCGLFGRYGIALSKEWGVKNGASPVIYVNPESEITNKLAITVAIADTGSLVAGEKNGIRTSLTSIYNLVSFVETSDNRSEYEWRIIGNTAYGNDLCEPRINKVTFSLSDIVHVVVPEQSNKNDITECLQNKAEIESFKGVMPKIILTDEIVLTEDDLSKINSIYKRS